MFKGDLIESPTSSASEGTTPFADVAIGATESTVAFRYARAQTRLGSIDIIRGLLMILMVLDHTRIYFSNVHTNPTDPLLSWPAFFATRWVTHLCAPGFIALAGASIYLQRQRGKTAEEAGRLLLTRGLWLLFLDLTLISFGWSFTFKAPFMNVISAIGLCMIGLAFLQQFSLRVVGIVGALIVLLHNLLDPIHAESLGPFANLWIILHQKGFLLYHGRHVVNLFFPISSWFGVICLGYAFGPVFTMPYHARRRIVLLLASVLLVTFIALRVFHGYGDAYRFERLGTPAKTMMSFFQVQKFPPSLHFILGTTGILLFIYLVVDCAVERSWAPRPRAFLEVYGRVPFIFYVLHIYLLHAITLAVSLATHGDWRFWIGPGKFWGGESPLNWGYDLPVVYFIWIAVVLALYAPCHWFSGLKARRRDWWLSYL